MPDINNWPHPSKIDAADGWQVEGKQRIVNQARLWRRADTRGDLSEQPTWLRESALSRPVAEKTQPG
jgi:hypothetical protein